MDSGSHASPGMTACFSLPTPFIMPDILGKFLEQETIKDKKYPVSMIEHISKTDGFRFSCFDRNDKLLLEFNS